VKKVSKQQLRPGSGHLIIKPYTDGPTRVLKISNIKNKSHLSINWEKTHSEQSIDSPSLNTDIELKNKSSKPLDVYINLTGGIGISLIQWLNQDYEELLYASLKSFEITFDQNQLEQKFKLSIQSIQICNQLINGFKQNLLCVKTTSAFSSTTSSSISSSSTTIATANPSTLLNKNNNALEIEFLRKFRNQDGPIYIEHLLINLDDLNLQIEERLLWKLIQFFGVSNQKIELSNQQGDDKLNNAGKSNRSHTISETTIGSLIDAESSTLATNYYRNQINSILSDSQAIKYSFNRFQINNLNMTLSVYKTSKLSTDLYKIKSSLGKPLVQFENAKIECKPFILMNEHDTASCILNLITKHYTQELRSNAMRILGSVDFLGNPVGLVVDFKESLSNIFSNGQVGDFLFSVTHGVANSFSKVSSSLSEELNELTMDEKHRETREQIRSNFNNGSIDHFVGGMIGFAVGVVGGALSIATQTYRGFNDGGMTGAFAGLGRGAVGTVSKPIVGMLDLATGVATAIRETSKTINKLEIPRIRETRCCSTSGALLASYSRSESNGQKILYQVNGGNLREKYIAMEQMNNKNDQSLVRFFF
jgi:vacuolar protein sorting-associated protein 13D